MAGEDNIKLAISHLDKATFEKMRHIKDLQSDLDRQRKELEKDIDRLGKSIAVNATLASNGDQSDARRVVATKAVSTFKSETDELKRQISQLHDTTKDEIKNTESDIMTLNDCSSNLKRIT